MSAPVDLQRSRRERTAGWSRWTWLIVAGSVGLPIVVLVVALAQRTWFPTGDLAQAELRMRSLPGQPPLLGAAGRITDEAGRQGNHPGPLMFWLTWPAYALLGRSSWAFEAATAFVNLAWVSVSVWLVRKRSTDAVTVWWGVVALVLIGGFGLDGLSQPWNPWVALLPFTVLVLCTWSALEDWRWAPVLGTFAASYALQGHAGYAPVALPLVGICVAAPLWSWWRDRTQTPWLPLLLAVAVGALSWSGPFADIVGNDPNNLSKLIANFSNPTEAPLGFAEGGRVLLRAMAPLGPWVWGGQSIGGSVLPGAALLVAWLASAAAIARGGRHRTLDRLNLVLGVAVLTGFYGVTRIFGAPYLYVFRWVAVLTAFVVFSTGWAVALLAAERWTMEVAPRRFRLASMAALVLLVALSAATAVRVSRQEIPYDYSWRMAAQLYPDVVDQLDPDQRYLVAWEDPVYLGGVGFGLVLELERQGFEVGAAPRFAAAVEPHRVRCPGDYDAVVTAVTGRRAIERWRQDRSATELAATGPGDATFDYDATFDELLDSLAADGSNLSPAQIEQNLTLLVLNPDQPERSQDLARQLVREGVPTAVFVQDPPPDPAELEPTATNAPCLN